MSTLDKQVKDMNKFAKKRILKEHNELKTVEDFNKEIEKASDDNIHKFVNGEDPYGRSTKQVLIDSKKRHQKIENQIEKIFDYLDNNNIKLKAKSPYGNSFYSTKNKKWDYTPNASYRISDHWNFKSKADYNFLEGEFFDHAEIHCKTDIKTEDGEWYLGKFSKKDNLYKIIKL